MIANKKEFEGLTITFNTTEDCNLRCKYCYEIDKKHNELKIEDARKFIDYILEDTEHFNKENFDSTEMLFEGLVLDFIGGDSLMNVEIVEQIAEYFIYKVNITDNENCRKWRANWRMSLSSNGTLFSNPKVKQFCEKYKDVISIGVSLDGCPEIHDKNRIMLARGPNGEEIGSMQYILKDWEWYKKTFPADASGTKATMAKDSIPYMFESLKYLVETLGLKYISQNFIMEDAGLTKDDYILFDKEMRKCVEYVLQHRDTLYWRMLDKQEYADAHRSQGEDWTKKGQCGSGCMPCLGVDGKIYPCFRWAPHTQTAETKDKLCCGDTTHGLDRFENFKKVSQGAIRSNCTKEQRCRECEFESACSYCIGGCYAEHGDFIRSTHICEIIKLQCKWAKVYWNEFNKLEGLPMEYDEMYQLDRVPAWREELLGTNKGI